MILFFYKCDIIFIRWIAKLDQIQTNLHSLLG